MGLNEAAGYLAVALTAYLTGLIAALTAASGLVVAGRMYETHPAMART